MRAPEINTHRTAAAKGDELFDVLTAACANQTRLLYFGARVAVWCSVVQCGAVWCSVVQCGAVWCRVVQDGAVWCSAVQCVAVRCSVMQCRVVHVRCSL